MVGREQAEHVIEVARAAKLENACRERRDPAKCKHGVNRSFELPPVEWLKNPRAANDIQTRQIAALYGMILEQVTLDGEHAGRAMHKDLHLGKQRTQTDGGRWICVPKEQAGGLAKRLGVSLRTLEHMLAALVAGKLLKVWQPDADKVPAELRGAKYAYNAYQVIGGVPAAVAGHIRRFVARLAQTVGNAVALGYATSERPSSPNATRPAAPPSEQPPAHVPDAEGMKAAAAIAAALRARPRAGPPS